MSKRPPQWLHLPDDLENKNVLVTGGTTGIGRATARLLAAQGARVMVFGRHEKELSDALADISEVGSCEGVIADQAKREDIETVFEHIDNKFGALHILINNAAIGSNSVAELSPDEIDYAVRANLLGYMHCAAEAIKRMSDGGDIVNVGSLSAQVREDSSGVYVATKAAIRAWSESARKSLNPRGIRVALVEPGRVATDMGGQSDAEKQLQRISDMEALAAEDIAEAILYCLLQPRRSCVVELQIRPLKQLI
jgi:NAD(P)-dependent dehydrogenase (short-subunit alcohol dehydrogenase family)